MHGGRVSPIPAVRPATGTRRPDERPVSVQVRPDTSVHGTKQRRGTAEPLRRAHGRELGRSSRHWCLRCRRRRRRRVWPTGLLRLLPAHGSPPPRGRRCTAGSLSGSYVLSLRIVNFAHYALMARPLALADPPAVLADAPARRRTVGRRASLCADSQGHLPLPSRMVGWQRRLRSSSGGWRFSAAGLTLWCEGGGRLR